MTVTKVTSEIRGAMRKIPMKNRYHRRWTLPIGSAKVQAADGGSSMRVNPVTVLSRFDGGMLYRVRGKQFLLMEDTFGGYPFLLTFAIETKNEQTFVERMCSGLPKPALDKARKACKSVASSIRLPEDLHNIEVDVTDAVVSKLKLRPDMALTKALMKVGMGTSPIACVCDVDGPCGYCCDTCDCNTCREAELNPAAIRARTAGRQ